MSIYKISIPVSDYYGEKVFFQEVYFEGNNCPTYQRLVDFLTNRNNWEHEQAEFNPENVPYCFAYEDCLNSLKYMEGEFPYITKHLYSSNTFVNHPKYGRQPLTVSRIYCEQC